jgi:hypothetical protein
MAGHRKHGAPSEAPPGSAKPLSVESQARLERLQGRLTKAEQHYDHLQEAAVPGSMRGQQDVAGQRSKVLQLRAEILEIEMGRRVLGSDAYRELREARDALLRAVKEADQAARAASQRGAEDDLRELMRQRQERNAARARFGAIP